MNGARIAGLTLAGLIVTISVISQRTQRNAT